MTTEPSAPDERLDLILTRDIAASPSLIWRAWTDPDQLKQWWAPAPLTTPECELEVRPGGLFRTLMRAPDGTEYPTQGCFLDLVENERIVFTDALTAGWRPAEKPFFTAIISLATHGAGTRYTARAMHRNVSDRKTHEDMGFHEGWGICTDQLANLVAEMKSKMEEGAR